jgi:hypothetical protein
MLLIGMLLSSFHSIPSLMPENMRKKLTTLSGVKDSRFNGVISLLNEKFLGGIYTMHIAS